MIVLTLALALRPIPVSFCIRAKGTALPLRFRICGVAV